ncbi:hypothetical protein AgCh_006162 [Apium graveolens]
MSGNEDVQEYPLAKVRPFCMQGVPTQQSSVQARFGRRGLKGKPGHEIEPLKGGHCCRIIAWVMGTMFPLKGMLYLGVEENSPLIRGRGRCKKFQSVKMAIFLEATDLEYLDIIYDGPHKPTKLSFAVGNEPQRMIPKEKREYTTKDISSLGKDAKEVRCQGTNAIKKNRKTILTQEYEHFDSKSNESLTDTYDRFTKLLNDLSLVDKEYDQEDSNLKFMLALPKKWDLKATTIRDNYELADMSLDEIYGMLKTHELEMEQRKKRRGGKSKIVSLKAEEKPIVSRKAKEKALII